MRSRIFLVLFFWISFGQIFAQKVTKEQKDLEARRIQLKKDIKQINNLLFSNTKTRKNALTEVENLQVKLQVRSELIKVTTKQANLLTKRITINERNILAQRE